MLTWCIAKVYQVQPWDRPLDVVCCAFALRIFPTERRLWELISFSRTLSPPKFRHLSTASVARSIVVVATRVEADGVLEEAQAAGKPLPTVIVTGVSRPASPIAAL